MYLVTCKKKPSKLFPLEREVIFFMGLKLLVSIYPMLPILVYTEFTKIENWHLNNNVTTLESKFSGTMAQ